MKKYRVPKIFISSYLRYKFRSSTVTNNRRPAYAYY